MELVVAIKQTAKYKFCALMLFYIIEKNYLNKICILFENLLPHRNSIPSLVLLLHQNFPCAQGFCYWQWGILVWRWHAFQVLWRHTNQ